MSIDLSTAVYDAVRCMPAVLCRIAADYAVQLPHTWPSTDRRITVVNIDDKNRTPLCRKIVPAVALDIGHLEWSVEFQPPAIRIGVGVTKSVVDRRTDWYRLNNNDDWLLIIYQDNGTFRIEVAGNGQLNTVFDSGPDYCLVERCRIDFEADPDRGKIVARLFYQLVGGKLTAIGRVTVFDRNRPVFYPSAFDVDRTITVDMPDVSALRPTIVLNGQMNVVVWSSG